MRMLDCLFFSFCRKDCGLREDSWTGNEDRFRYASEASLVGNHKVDHTLLASRDRDRLLPTFRFGEDGPIDFELG